MGFADQRVTDGITRWRTRRIEARLSAIEDAADAGTFGGAGGGAPTSAQYVTLAANATLTNERVLTGSSSVSVTDGGAGSTVTLAAITGTTAGTVCAGDDARLSDARTPTAHSHSLLPKIRLPPTFQIANLTATKSITTGTTFAVYMGKADAAYSSVVVRFRVTTQAATITWAEVAIATGTPSPGGNPSLTRRGHTDVSAVVNSIGQKSVTVNVSGIAAGDDIWVLIGNAATTVAVVRAGLADDLQLGGQASAAVRPSTMGTPQAFTIESATAVCPWVGLQT